MLALLLLLLVGTLVLLNRLRAIAQRLDALDRRLRSLEARTPGPLEASPAGARTTIPEGPPSVDTPTGPPAIGSPAFPVATAAAPIRLPEDSVARVLTPRPDALPRPATLTSTPDLPGSSSDLETTIGSRWMLVVGTVVLVLGVAFFLKYAFDNNWINETARVVGATFVGLLLWFGGLRLVDRGYQPYGRVIAGGGLAIVYITAYAAHALFDLVSAGVAFAWMAAVSATTAATADRQRSLGLALTAIVLAYFAPLLVGRDGSHLAFFAYILVLGAVTLLLTRRHDWPGLGLSALYLTVATTAMWAARSFSPDLFASTEVYLTVAFAIFVLVLRAPRSSVTALARASAFVLLGLPVLYHSASLAVLYPHSVPFLGYLILGTTVAVAVPAIRDSALARLGVWAVVSAPFYGWLLTHTSGVWYAAAVATAIGIYLLHLIAQFLAMSETNRPSTAEVALFHMNGLSLFLFTYVAVNANAGSTPLLAASLALWNGALAWGCHRRVAEGTAQALALAFALAATAIALAFVGPWITVGWAAEGAAVVWIGLAMNRPFFRRGGAVLLALATLRLIAFQFPVTIASHTPVLNSRVGAAAFIVVLLYAVASLYRRHAPAERREGRVAIAAATVSANALTVLLITAEIRSFWELRERALTVDFARQLSLSLAWAVYAVGLIVLGFRRAASTLRYMALALFGLTVAKMFAIDLLTLDGIYRIVGFIGLGVMLLGASFLYQRSIGAR